MFLRRMPALCLSDRLTACHTKRVGYGGLFVWRCPGISIPDDGGGLISGGFCYFLVDLPAEY